MTYNFGIKTDELIAELRNKGHDDFATKIETKGRGASTGTEYIMGVHYIIEQNKKEVIDLMLIKKMKELQKEISKFLNWE